MLRKESPDMTVQSVDPLSTKSGETMPQQPSSQTKNGHISFSVASLLADTRPGKAESPTTQSEDEYDSNQEDSIVDVEDLNPEEKGEEQRFVQRDFHQGQGPIRPTPFSALAAAVYSAATHPGWGAQGLVGPFGGPGPMFQGHAPFGVPNIGVGK